MLILGKPYNKTFYGDKRYFEKYQCALLLLLNNPIKKIREKTREFFGIDFTEPITKLTPNACHKQVDKDIFIAEIYSGNVYEWAMKRNFEAFQRLLKGLHWFDINIANPFVPALNLGFDTLTAYSTTADGQIQAWSSVSWADVYAKTSGSVYSTITNEPTAMQAGKSGSYWLLRRSYFYFDTSTIPSNATISSSVFSLYGVYNANSNVSVQKGTQSATLASSNFAAFSGTSFGSATWKTNQYVDITLNPTGVAWTLNNSACYFCTREYAHDYGNVDPDPNNYNNGCYYADNTGTAQDPKLVVTYSLPSTLINSNIY